MCLSATISRVSPERLPTGDRRLSMSSPFSGWEALLIGGDARAPHADGALAGHERLADGVCVLCDTCIPCLVDKQAWSGLPSFDGPVGELHRALSSHSKKRPGTILSTDPSWSWPVPSAQACSRRTGSASAKVRLFASTAAVASEEHLCSDVLHECA